jgi:hypothetical protein
MDGTMGLAKEGSIKNFGEETSRAYPLEKPRRRSEGNRH